MEIIGRVLLVLGGLAATVPIALGVLAYSVATVSGCVLSSGGAHSCVVFGMDIGNVLSSMMMWGMVLGMLGFIPGLIVAGIGVGFLAFSNGKKA